jgi:type IV pilus assembly protein PilB
MDINQYIASQFVEQGLIREKEKAQEILTESKKTGTPFYKLAPVMANLEVADCYALVGHLFNMQYVTVSTYNIDDTVAQKVPITFIKECRVVPISIENGKVNVVTDSPFKFPEIDIVRSFFAEPLNVEITTPTMLDNLVNNITGRDRRIKAAQEFSKENSNLPGKGEKDQRSLNEYVNAPSVQFADTLLEEAVAQKASDIHIEPLDSGVRVRFRIDGILVHHCDITPSLFPAIIARYKIMAGMDIAERRLPQDGKISRVLGGKTYDFRVSTLPNIYGENLVIRIFNTLGAETTIHTLANTPEEEIKFKELIRAPHGIIMLTGPTGSGKTTTLYTFLKELNKPGVNIQTVEDPVENQMVGINQLQVNTKTGLTFGNALRSILRQDPNIIMIGEIRDEETAHIAVQAAITGHLVLTTVHTNDAATCITRLIDMGVEPYLVADSLVGAISQRLVRKLCPDCKKEHHIDEAESKVTGLKKGTLIYEPCGCSKCNYTGYTGRTAVFEIMTMDDKIRQSVDVKHFSFDVTKDIVEHSPGFISLREAGAHLVEEGVTSIEEFEHLVNIIDIDKKESAALKYLQEEEEEENETERAKAAKAAEETKRDADAKKAEDIMKAEETKKLEEEKKLEEQKKIEEDQKNLEKIKAEEEKPAEEKKKDEVNVITEVESAPEPEKSIYNFPKRKKRHGGRQRDKYGRYIKKDE